MIMVDVILNIDSLILDENEYIEDIFEYLRKNYSFGSEPTYEILHKEKLEEGE